MELFSSVLLLLVLIGLSKIINRFVPFVPVPLIQIGLGALAAAAPVGIHLSLEPELFFVLFIAPLLYNDGRRTPRDELWNLRAQILLLALGLVFATVVVAGYAIHWMIPSIPLAAAFALAAILSPTDAVAVSALAGRVHLPKGTHRLLEGESLMNDASGLVAFKFAVAAAVTGVFSFSHAVGSFILIAAGGLLAGAVLSFLLIRLSVLLQRLGMEDVTMHVLLQILTPFLIYLVSEEIGVSGILAVVAGGIVHAVEKDRTTSPQYKLQLVSASIWSMLLFVLNGLVFLILGVSLPDVASVILRDEAFDNTTVLLYVLAITALLIVLRFLWVYAFAVMNNAKNGKRSRPQLKGLALLSVSGVRGAVTLAGAFSIPLYLDDGSRFPERDLIIFLAAGVILATLLLASIALPLMAGKEEEVQEESEQVISSQIKKKCVAILKGEESGSAAAAAAGMAAIAGMAGLAARSLGPGIPALSGAAVAENGALENGAYSPSPAMSGGPAGEQGSGTPVPSVQGDAASVYAGLLGSGGLPVLSPEAEKHARQRAKAKLTGLQAERSKLLAMMEEGSVPADTGRAMLEFLDRKEAFLARDADSQFRQSLGELGRMFARLFTKAPEAKGEGAGEGSGAIASSAECVRRARIEMCRAAVDAVKRGDDPEIRGDSEIVAAKYGQMIDRLESVPAAGLAELEESRKFLGKLEAFQEQRDSVQRMFEDGALSFKAAAGLRRFMDQLETSIWED